MSIKKIQQKENQIVFFADIDETIANSIRRYINEIPIYAVDEVEISKNDSALNDESVAHRIGLIPLKSEKVSGNKEKIISVSTKKEGLVYSGDFKGEVEVVYEKMPITLLLNGQELKIKGIVKAGIGSQHTKFSPGVLFYRNPLEITISKKFAEEIKEKFPKNEIKEKAGKIIVIDDQKSEIGDFCENLVEKNNEEINIEKKDGLIISVESFGQISYKEILKRAISALKKDLSSLKDNINKI